MDMDIMFYFAAELNFEVVGFVNCILSLLNFKFSKIRCVA